MEKNKTKKKKTKKKKQTQTKKKKKQKKTRLFKYTENFTTKNDNFSEKKILIFFIFLLKT